VRADLLQRATSAQGRLGGASRSHRHAPGPVWSAATHRSVGRLRAGTETFRGRRPSRPAVGV